MGSQELVTEAKLFNLEESLQEIPISMRFFSVTMRSLYAEGAVGGSNDATQKFQKLRDDTRNDAMVYLNGILPVTTKFISNLQVFFENYTALTFEEWKECLEDIVEEAEEHKQVAHALVELHKDLLVTLKQREDSAAEILLTMKNLTSEYERKCAEFESSADNKSNWAFALAFIPGVNAVATPLLTAYAQSDMANAVATCQQANIAQAAALLVEKSLIPALKAFINGLEKATGFLNTLHQELNQFQNTNEKAKENPKKKHYLLMKNKGASIVSGCRGFYAVIPSVQTDFEAIPKEGTDKNYVDRWLEEQQKIIFAQITLKSVAKKFVGYLKSASSAVEDK